MKNKRKIWYIGYVISFLLIIIVFFTDFPKMVDIALLILYSLIFSVSRVQILHNKMLETDRDYKIDMMDERSIMIKDKVGSITNIFNTVLFGFVTVIFIALDYLIPAIITGVILLIQPIILIGISIMIEKKM